MIAKQQETTYYDVVGIGNAIVDVLAKVGEGFLKERQLEKGGMTLVDAVAAGKIYADLVPEREGPGGSAANTVAGLASLGGAPAFIGKIHDDELGQVFTRDIGVAGVDFFTPPLNEGPVTGRSIVLVTPDAQRSMFTYLGASKKLTVEDIDENIIKASRITYLEAYLWDEQCDKEAMIKAAEIAHDHGRDVAFSLSDKSCVNRHREEFLEFIKTHVDILFGNEDEIVSLFNGEDFYKTLDLIKPHVDIAAITRGAKGSVVAPDGTLKSGFDRVKERIIDEKLKPALASTRKDLETEGLFSKIVRFFGHTKRPVACAKTNETYVLDFFEKQAKKIFDKQTILENSTRDSIASEHPELLKLYDKATKNSEKRAKLLIENAPDYLVKKGMPFRTAYKKVGEIVAYCIDNGLILENMPLEKYKEFADRLLQEADVIFCLDLNEPKRVEKMADALLAAPGRRVLIDHHLHPADFCRLTISHPEISSTSEMI